MNHKWIRNHRFIKLQPNVLFTFMRETDIDQISVNQIKYTHTSNVMATAETIFPPLATAYIIMPEKTPIKREE